MRQAYESVAELYGQQGAPMVTDGRLPEGQVIWWRTRPEVVQDAERIKVASEHIRYLLSRARLSGLQVQNYVAFPDLQARIVPPDVLVQPQLDRGRTQQLQAPLLTIAIDAGTASRAVFHNVMNEDMTLAEGWASVTNQALREGFDYAVKRTVIGPDFRNLRDEIQTTTFMYPPAIEL